MNYFACVFLVLCFIFTNQIISAQNTSFIDLNIAPIIEEFGGSVNAIAKQPDGKILVGGFFYLANSKKRFGLARFNADGGIDESFNPPIGVYPAGVRAIVVRPDGKILVGGLFDSPTVPFRNIMLLNENGSENTAFTANTNSTVHAIALQPDGKIFIGGAFTEVNGGTRFGIARLNANGSVDTSFSLSLRTIYAIAVQPDGSVLLGGNFVLTSPNAVRCIAKVSSTGAIDTAFSSNAATDSMVEAIKLQSDGKILIGGLFKNVNNVNRAGIARLNGDGTLDTSFNSLLNGGRQSVESIDIDPAGKILIGGSFTTAGSAARSNISKLNDDGSPDTTFAPGAGTDAVVRAVFAESDGKSLVGGEFVNFNGSTKYRLARLSVDGNLLASFNAAININGVIYDIETQPDGKFIAAGNFFFVNGVATSSIARFMPDGTLDPTFAGFAQSQIYGAPIEDIEILPDGKIVIVGAILFASNTTIYYSVVRLNSNGTLDTTFAPVRLNDNYPTVVKALPNGQIIVGGGFNRLNGFAKSKLAKINTNGSLDTAFNPTFGAPSNPVVVDINVRGDGKILVGGYFETINGVAKNNLAQLNQDGTVAPNFTANASTTVNAIEKLSDGSLLISGFFTTVNGIARNRVAKLSENGAVDPSFDVDAAFGFPNIRVKNLPDGKIVLAGQKDYFSTLKANLVVLNPNGSLNTFLPNSRGFDGGIYDVEVQSDGKILVGGAFTKVENSARYGLARLNSLNFSLKTRFDYDGDGRADISLFRPSDRVWYIQNSGNGVSFTQFGLATDRIAPADYDGDGKTDIAVFRPETGVWFIAKSTGGFQFVQFGTAEDLPQPGDFNGDGKAEVAVFRPSTGVWFILNTDTFVSTATQYGASEDKPVAADYDGDGKTEIAVYRPSLGVWFLLNQTTGQTNATRFGIATDKPVQADYDGDGKVDIAVYRPNEGNWYILPSTGGFTVTKFGLATDVLTPADYDGDGKTDFAIYRPSEGNWYLLQSTQGFSITRFGLGTDRPTPNAFVY